MWGAHVGWLQLPEVWQSVNKETKAVNHWLGQFLLGSFKACHGFSFLHVGKSPVLPQTQTWLWMEAGSSDTSVARDEHGGCGQGTGGKHQAR